VLKAIYAQEDRQEALNKVQAVAEACECELSEIKTGRQHQDFMTDPSKPVVFHFTPTHASSLNQVEIWLSVLTHKVIQRGDF